MEEWVVRLGPWLRLLRHGTTLALQQVRGRPRLLAVAAVATVSSVTIYKYVTKNFGKWKRLGVPYEEGRFPYGSFDLSSLSSMLVALPALHLKHSPSSPYFGWFMFGQPILNITDPDLLRAVQVRDFNNFVERSSYDGDMFEHGGEYDRLWSKQLTALKGEEWKHVRATFSPIFTSGKMKGMLNFIKLTADNLVEKFEGSADGREEVALKSMFGCYTMDGLATAAFGMDINSFGSDESVFTRNATQLFKSGALETTMMVFKCLVPGLGHLLEALNINIWKKKETKFFYDVIKSSMRARKEGRQGRRNDLIDLMMDSLARELAQDNEGQEQYERDMALEVDSKKAPLNEEMLVCTAMTFLLAGYDTTASTLAHAAYLLAKHPEEQTRLQEEVDQAFEEAAGEFPDYSTVQGLPFLDMVVHETLRLHGPVPVNTREAAADYTLPGTTLTLSKGDLVSFAPGGLHRDPQHWAHPDSFHPEHFSKEAKSARSPYAFQAFGQGPRACIGMRFALLEAKVALVAVCRRLTFLPGTRAQEPLEQDTQAIISWPRGGLWARLERRT